MFRCFLRFGLLVVLSGCGRLEERDPVDERRPPDEPPNANAVQDGGVVNPARPPSGSGRILLQTADDFSALWASFTPDVPPAPAEAPPVGCRVLRGPSSEPAAREASAGTIRVIGLEKGRRFSMETAWNAKERRYRGAAVKHAPLDPSALSFEAKGGEVPAFVATLPPLGALALEAPKENDVVVGGDLTVTWATADRAPTWVTLHVGFLASATCFVEDGARTVTFPRAIVDTLIAERTAAGMPPACSAGEPSCAEVDVVLTRSTEVRAGDELVTIDHFRVETAQLAIGPR